MKLYNTIKFIVNHPLNKQRKIKAILNFLKWQISSRYLNPYPIIYPFTEKTRLIIEKGMQGATGNLYCGLHEYADMMFLLHFLRKEDTFADIGANIGSYTILASGHVGAKTFCFEPIPATFSRLMGNIVLNKMENKTITFNIALGSKKGNIKFTKSFDTTNHVAAENEIDVLVVPVATLDSVLENQQIPSLLKIDVEGFEAEVIMGGGEVLKNNALKAILIELNGSGKKYGYNDSEISTKLLETGFSPYVYIPKLRKLVELCPYKSVGINTLYVRDVDFVSKRLECAEKIKIFEKYF